MIHSRYHEATYRHAHHMGSGEHIPAYAEAWLTNKNGKTTASIEITHTQYPNLEPHQLTAKAVAILRHQTKG